MRNAKRTYVLCVTAVLLASALLLCGAVPARAAGLLIADGGFGGVLEIEEHAVDVTINNGIAVTRVTQVFRNTEDRQVEALYTFPVPKKASVANFSMWINGVEMIGEVLEKERAREIYNSYKQVRRDPGLLEQNDYKSFEMRIFPIGPRAEQRVEITYYQELDVDGDWATWVYPLATVSHEGVESRTTGRMALTLEVLSEVPIVDMESPSHGDDFAIARHSPHHRQASLEVSGGDLNQDIVVAYKLSRAQTGFDLITARPDGEDGYFLLTLTAGEELKRRQRGMDYVFVLDISGSMDEDGKLGLSRGSLGSFISGLSEEDRFEVMTFNLTPENLFADLRAADPGAKAEAVDFLARQRAKGGTFLEPALRSAYAYKDADRPLNIVILSDGMTDTGERQTLLRLIGERPSGARVFSIGVGNEVNRPLLEQLADDTGGLAAFLSRNDDLDRQARAFRRKLMRPAATNVEITFESGDVYDVEPLKLPALYQGVPLRLYGRYRDAGPARLRLHADVGGELLERTVELELPERDPKNPELERMWAWHRIQRLLKEADRSGSRAGVIDEIVRLGEAYSIVSEYTSFLVLENDGEYKRWRIERRNALRIERDRAAQAELRRELEGMRTTAARQVGPVKAEKPIEVAAAQPAQPTTRTAAPQARSRGWDLDFGGGGGALDPLSALLAAGVAGVGLAASRRRRR